MKYHKFIQPRLKKGTWAYGLVRDDDGVIKVCEWLFGGYAIVGKQGSNEDGVPEKPCPMTVDERNMILADLFVGIGVKLGIDSEDLRLAIGLPPAGTEVQG